MGKYIKLYKKDSEYHSDLSNDKIILPNVSFTEDARKVYYNPSVIGGSMEKWETIFEHEGASIPNTTHYWGVGQFKFSEGNNPVVGDEIELFVDGVSIGKSTAQENETFIYFNYPEQKGLWSLFTPKASSKDGYVWYLAIYTEGDVGKEPSHKIELKKLIK